MALNWTTGELMRPAGCLPCCAGEEPPPPAECACAFSLPVFPFGGVFSTLAEAIAELADYAFGCFAVADFGGGTSLASQGLSSSSVDVSVANEITTQYDFASTSSGSQFLRQNFSVSIDAGTLTLDVTVAGLPS